MDKKQKFVKFFSTEVKSVDVDKMTVHAIVSTKKRDRDGDIVMPEAFKKRLKVYKEHPVLLSSHFYYDLKSQIGEAQKVEISDDGLEVVFKYYAGEGNDQADWAFNLAQKGIAAFSIGFMGWGFEWIKEKDSEGVERVTGRKYTDVELLEISQVLVPSNRGALQSGRSYLAAEAEVFELAAKAFDKGDLVEREIKEAEKKPDLCGCEILEMVKGVDEESKKCGVCEKVVADDKIQAIKNFCVQVSGKHYSEALLPTGTGVPLLSAKEAGEAVREAMKEINNKGVS